MAAADRLEPGQHGWLLTPDALDHLATYTTTPPEEAHQPAEQPVDGAYRPHGGDWPEDGITLTYGELRRLIALHLAQFAHTMPRHQPWLAAEAAAQAMADGETPLRLREVME